MFDREQYDFNPDVQLYPYWLVTEGKNKFLR